MYSRSLQFIDGDEASGSNKFDNNSITITVIRFFKLLVVVVVVLLFIL